MIERMKQIALQALEVIARTAVGTVSDYDPDIYAVRVKILPTGEVTGWIPIASHWVGNGFGMVAGPNIGDMVRVDFIDGSRQAMLMGGRYFNDQDLPPAVPSGECWLVHSSGSVVKLLNSGDIVIEAAANLTASAPNGTLRLAGQVVQIHASQAYSWDSGGYGEKWTANGSPNWTHKTWQTGAVVTADPHAINPPEGS